MATVKDKKDVVEAGENYITGSLIVKSADDLGVVLKWLDDDGTGKGDRKERFVELDPTESSIPKYDDRTAVSVTDINNPQ